ncbi:MAG: ATP synthase F0 subunit A [Candidatus Delongbacteria bacterium]|nr:MAG: ATP synthase F0 subunit A [Candidatus Delongbacteria bacterium]
MMKLKKVGLILFLFLFVTVPVFGSGGGESHSPSEVVDHHLKDSNAIEIPFAGEVHLPHFPTVNIGGVELDFSPTKHFVFFWFSAILLLLIIKTFYKKDQAVQTGLFGNAIEKFVLFVRDDIVKPAIPHGYNQVLPHFLTVFFVLFIVNYIGLVPFSATSTGNISVTAGMAITTLIMMVVMGVKVHGPVGYIKTFMPIKDMGLLPSIILNTILFPIELIGLITKPFALAIRLYANMSAGHVIILTILLMGWGGAHMGWNHMVSPATILGAVFISLLEVLVCFLQAYVFTLLSALFVGMAMSHDH